MTASPILLNTTFDLTTVIFISALIVLSVLSLCFIFHLRFKSKSLTFLQGFNSLWTVRFLLVLFVFFWSIVELLRLPFFRRRYLYSFFPALATSHQTNLCKINIVLSLGFFEPAFLVTLLFLLNASITKKTPKDTWAITFVFVTCVPLVILHGLLVYFDPLENQIPVLLRQNSVVLADDTVLCTYPFLNSLIFAAFGAAYCTWFLFSCWRVLSLVINKNLRIRIYALGSVVLVALPLQVVSLAFTVIWTPEDEIYGVASLVVFLGAFCCAVTGEGILVIKPISDALDAGGNCCSSWSNSRRQQSLPPPPPKETKMEERDADVDLEGGLLRG
ncbi:plasminogen activator inhibitor [Trifolium repens]|nr:plasminogen activator inhibitor [Trifolium repens]